MQEKLNIELTPEQARALVDGSTIGEAGIACKQATIAIKDALRKHNEESNPLGAPWAVEKEGATFAVWGVRGSHIAGNVNEQMARLIAAAPDLADALEAMLRWVDGHGWRKSAAMREAFEALAKAGRR